jgi:hypothetical protein
LLISSSLVCLATVVQLLFNVVILHTSPTLVPSIKPILVEPVRSPRFHHSFACSVSLANVLFILLVCRLHQGCLSHSLSSHITWSKTRRGIRSAAVTSGCYSTSHQGNRADFIGTRCHGCGGGMCTFLLYDKGATASTTNVDEPVQN